MSVVFEEQYPCDQSRMSERGSGSWLRAERGQPRWCGALWTREDSDPELRRVVMALTLRLGLGVRAGGGHCGDT